MARANHPAGIAAEVVADFYLATYAQVLAAEVLTYIVPELWLSSEDGVLRSIGYFAILVELHVSILVKHTSVVFPPEISHNFGSNAGWMVRPCLGVKWDF